MSKRAGQSPKEPRELKNCADTRTGLSAEQCQMKWQDERGRRAGRGLEGKDSARSKGVHCT